MYNIMEARGAEWEGRDSLFAAATLYKYKKQDKTFFMLFPKPFFALALALSNVLSSEFHFIHLCA
jgi:hypothetical protein